MPPLCQDKTLQHQTRVVSLVRHKTHHTILGGRQIQLYHIAIVILECIVFDAVDSKI